MPTFAVNYRYADQPAALGEHRPAHRAFLAQHADAGRLLAAGRFADEGPGKGRPAGVPSAVGGRRGRLARPGPRSLWSGWSPSGRSGCGRSCSALGRSAVAAQSTTAAATPAATAVTTEVGPVVTRPTAIAQTQAIAAATAYRPPSWRARSTPTPAATARTTTAAPWATAAPGRTPEETKAAVTLAQVATLTQPR